jgi:putative ABC transport system substrate-binding protein
VTGVSDLLALDKQMDLVKQVVPNAKRIGMVYNPGEANSAVVVKELQALLPKMGWTLVTPPLPARWTSPAPHARWWARWT